MFLARTVADILKNKRGKTEVIVGLDGEWADPPIEDHKDVRIVYRSESIGQRAITNELCRLSKAKYVMKVDAHTAWDEGFDVKLLADMQDDWTMVPVMRNLHVFDWLCTNCKHTIYQGPTPEKCPECGSKMEKNILWKAKESPRSTSFRFDKTLHFQYFGEYKKVQDATASHLVETMSLQGSCFLLTRDKYWELDICDENHGSWGQQGVEVAVKTWLSGGRVICNKNTWYAHMFRTQGGDFGFPYPLSGNQVDKARKYSRDLFLNNKWEKAIHPLSWLIEKFAPVPDWNDSPQKLKDEEIKKEVPEVGGITKGIIYYTDNQLNGKIAHAVQDQLNTIGLPIVSSSLKPMPHFGKNIQLSEERGPLTMFKQILVALEASNSDIIFFCEHDVVYHPSHFEFTPPTKDKFYYNQYWWRVRTDDGFCVSWEANQVSGLVVYRDLAIEYYKERVKFVEENGWNNKLGYEPGGRNTNLTVGWKSKYPNVDYKHGNNLSKNKWSLNDFRDKSTAKNFRTGTTKDIEGWDFSKGLLKPIAFR